MGNYTKHKKGMAAYMDGGLKKMIYFNIDLFIYLCFGKNFLFLQPVFGS